MNNFIVFFYKALCEVTKIIYHKWSALRTKLIFSLNGIEYGSGLITSGTPYVHLSRRGRIQIGNNLSLGNWVATNASGLKGKCKLEARNGAVLTIGNNVGMTATTIICHQKVIIEDNVMIGVGTHIYDTNFHNISSVLRIDMHDPQSSVKSAPIILCKNAFIGAYSIILKGVSIGENSIVAAGSVVVKSIPNNQIWGGNPAKFIKCI